MKDTNKKLLTFYGATIAVAGCICLYFEILHPEHIGCLFDESDRTLRTVFENVSIISSLAIVYGALKMFALTKVRRLVQTEHGYLHWALLRWGMISLALLLCELTYYVFFSTNVVAFIGILAITLLFVWPTEARMKREMGNENELNEDRDDA